MNTLCLSHTKPNAELRLNTDTSDVAIGNSLEQLNEDRWEPLGFFS